MDLKVTGFVKDGRATGDPTGGFFTAEFDLMGRKAFYRTMQRANIGRMYAAALRNAPKTNKRSKTGWANLARATGIIKHGYSLNKGNFTSGVSSQLYGWAMAGKLPDDKEQRDKLLNIAGEPWSSDPSLRL